ncbi:uncharacterized protein N7484_004905 [Penicillium longicatenatum]|uniref:uncharacterized protein n=1 Tax=Penicillium longicatenatum TaxID=1561947 RepID=UPI002547F854|nr:uncharacterized protein N7484_004905 [Penicillium longicatenatum]KAJ5651182.1 hypothetical protein N7484_004905 [Penicillium longicatenatum]
MELSDGGSVHEESASYTQTPDSSIKDTSNYHVDSSSQEVSPRDPLINDVKNSDKDLNFDTSDARTLEEFYFTQWRACVTPILPPVFTDLTLTIPTFLPFKYAVLAVTAAHLAHTGASIRSGDDEIYIPERTHRYRSLQYYGKGIRELAEYVNGFPDENLDHLVATSLLFYYIEIDVGSINSAVEHIELINRLHCSAQSHVKEGSIKLNPKLLSTWKSSRSLAINKRLTIGSNRSRPLAAIQPRDPTDSSEQAGTSSDIIAQLLCETFSSARKIIVEFFVCRGTRLASEEQSRIAFGALVEHISSPNGQTDSPGQSTNAEESYLKEFEQNRKNLDNWHAHLDLSELPVESFTSASTEPIGEKDGELHVQPLRFRTYGAAMNYAYYATAQHASSQQMINRLTAFAHPDIDSSFTRENYPWESLLLRIACGLDLEDCLYKHTFKIGILSLLICIASSCPHIGVANWIHDWMGKLGNYGRAVEDGMPVVMVMRVMRLIIAMKQDGHDAFRISVLDSDSKEKEEFYHGNIDLKVAVCGKDRVKGIMYNNVVALPK